MSQTPRRALSRRVGPPCRVSSSSSSRPSGEQSGVAVSERWYLIILNDPIELSRKPNPLMSHRGAPG